MTCYVSHSINRINASTLTAMTKMKRKHRVSRRVPLFPGRKHTHKPVHLEFHCPPISSSPVALQIDTCQTVCIITFPPPQPRFSLPLSLTDRGNNAIGCQAKRHNCTLALAPRRPVVSQGQRRPWKRTRETPAWMSSGWRERQRGLLRAPPRRCNRPVIKGSQRKWLTQLLPWRCRTTLHANNAWQQVEKTVSKTCPVECAPVLHVHDDTLAELKSRALSWK